MATTNPDFFILKPYSVLGKTLNAFRFQGSIPAKGDSATFLVKFANFSEKDEIVQQSLSISDTVTINKSELSGISEEEITKAVLKKYLEITLI